MSRTVVIYSRVINGDTIANNVKRNYILCEDLKESDQRGLLWKIQS